MKPLSQSRARRLWLHAQRLDERAPFGAGPPATRAAVEHLGYVQIDTIHVIERCHHQILYTRIPEYRRSDLHHAQSIEKSLFEYWTHALSYVPTRDLRFYVRDMLRHRRSSERWFGTVTAAELRKVLTIRDIEDDVLVEKVHEWASRKPSKRALQLAFYRGVLTISERAGMLKSYELLTRHFGWDRLPPAASPREVAEYLLERALNAQGIVSLDSVCYGNAPLKPAVRRAIEAQIRARTLVSVSLEGAAHWATPQALEAPLRDTPQLVHILSPFDPLIVQRKRLKLFFDYEHRFEAYLPREKRVFGYFTQPVLIGDEIVALLDLKTDRVRGKLLLQRWTWLAQHARRERKRQIEEALDRFERFQLAR